MSFLVYLFGAILLLATTGCETFSKRTEANRALSLLDHGVKQHIGGNPEEAIKSYEEVLSFTKDPEMQAAAFGNIGLALIAIGKAEEAQLKFEQVVSLTKHLETKARALNNIGELRQKQGDFQSARTSYEEALLLTTDESLVDLINKHLKTLDK